MRDRPTRSVILLSSILLLSSLLFAAPAFGAGIDVPSLELFTWGRLEGGTFGFDTRGDMDLRIDGGYKFAGRVLFGFSSSTLETAAFNDTLSFTSASVTLRQLFGLPLDFTWFVGQAESFCTGELFPERFGAAPLASNYHSFVHFPDSEYTYEGIYSPNGTGLLLEWSPGEARTLLSCYLYQDSSIDEDGLEETLDSGHFSADLRAALDFEHVKLEAFFGASYPVPDGSLGYYRGGLLFYAGEKTVEFLAQLGIPRWNPAVDAIGADLLYLFVEPRVRFGAFAVAPSFFWRPGYFVNRDTRLLEDTGEQAFDVNLDLQIGKPAEWPVAGGIEGRFVYQTEELGAPVNEIHATASPYLRLLTVGVTWELRVPVKLYPFDPSNPAEVFLTIDAEF
ncbi:MAG: hypothetical protein JW820_08465 [Spirochaetales bacterium]|nr:hypothetical protein [Spirochaetales bacterium]